MQCGIGPHRGINAGVVELQPNMHLTGFNSVKINSPRRGNQTQKSKNIVKEIKACYHMNMYKNLDKPILNPKVSRSTKHNQIYFSACWHWSIFSLFIGFWMLIIASSHCNCMATFARGGKMPPRCLN